MNKWMKKLTAALCAAVLMCGMAVTAYAGGGEEWDGLDPVSYTHLVVRDIHIGHRSVTSSLGQFVPKSGIVGSTSLPHTSQPGEVCRANSSTRGKSPMRATILSRVSSGFLLWASMGEMINW